MCVTLTDTQELATYVIRTFQLQRVSSAHVRSFTCMFFRIAAQHHKISKKGGLLRLSLGVVFFGRLSFAMFIIFLTGITETVTSYKSVKIRTRQL